MKDMGVLPSPTNVRAAAVQIDVKLGDVQGNLRRVLDRLDEAADHGAQLVVFPEAALSGYCFSSLEQAAPHCLLEAELTEALKSRCSERGVCSVVGFLERAGANAATARIYNSALLVARNVSGAYRKTHLPTLGVDRFVDPGLGFAVFYPPVGSVGLLICYDIRFPEAARCLNLMGAEILALPTNWPEGAESAPDFLTRARAWENRMYVIAANRVGVERGRHFIGRSQIVSPTGQILCEAGPEEETILYADLDLDVARQKRIVIERGQWELDITGDRRPELYNRLVESTRT